MHPLLSGWCSGERLREAAAPPALVFGAFFFLVLMGLVKENGCDLPTWSMCVPLGALSWQYFAVLRSL